MDLAGEGIFVALAAVMAGLGQLWFWRLRLGEERTIWLGCAALVAAGTAVMALSILLVVIFPEGVFPWVQTLVLAILAIFFIFLLMFPIVLVVTLIATGMRLVRSEGRGLRNMLSLGLGCAMVAYVTIWPFARSALSDVPVFGNVFASSSASLPCSSLFWAQPSLSTPWQASSCSGRTGIAATMQSSFSALPS